MGRIGLAMVRFFCGSPNRSFLTPQSLPMAQTRGGAGPFRAALEVLNLSEPLPDVIPTGESRLNSPAPATSLRSAEIHHGVGKIAKPDLGPQHRLSRIKRIGLEPGRR